MDPLTMGLLTAGSGLLGSIFSSNTSANMNAANIQQQQMTNQMTIAENQKNRDFQEQMSSTAYQRASADMTKAGLNPMAMFGSGGPASSPAGGVPSLQAPRATENPGRPFEQLGHIASSAMNAAVTSKTYDKLTEEIANANAENARIKAATGLTREMERTQFHRTQTESAESILRASGIPQATIDRLEKEGVLKYLSKDVLKMIGAGEYGIDKGKKVIDTINPFVSGAKSIGRYYHEWKPPRTGLSPSQTRELYDKFREMNGQ